MSKDAVNLTVSFVHNDKAYDGVTLNAGVEFEVVNELCVSSLKFTNAADAPEGILLQGVSAVDVPAIAFRPYLQLWPAA